MPGEASMSQGAVEAGKAGPITIDDLAALNDEIAALVRAGVPLERGLLRAGDDLPGRLKTITQVLGSRLNRGESLPAALEAEKSAIPPLYRAIVEAGSRSGRLSAALEGLARYVRSYSEARAAIGVALWYPILVLSLAYALFLGLVIEVVPRFIGAFESLGLEVIRPLHWLEQVGELAPYWWPVWPVLLVLLGIAWVRSGNAASFQASSWSLLRIFPWMRSLLSDYEAAGFADLLSLLLDHKVALPKAVVLAAEATGDVSLIGGAHQLAAGVERGESPAKVLRSVPNSAFRPLLRWALATGQDQGSLVESVRNLGPMYRKRGAFQAEKLQLFLPTILMILLGASATLLYALTLFTPLAGLLRGLSSP
jgi:general secretion pathway protein F